MTRPAPHPRKFCGHCGCRIIPAGRSWTHDQRRDNRADECIVNSYFTGDLAHPADTPCPPGCAGRMRDLIERSSLGTPEAKALRESVSDEDVQKVMRRLRDE